MSYIPLESYIPQAIDYSPIDLSSLATTTVVDVTEAGVLVHIGFEAETAITGDPMGTVTITVDGATPASMEIFKAGNEFSQELHGAARQGSGPVSQDSCTWILGTRYAKSLKVEVTITSGGTGTLGFTVSRAKRV
ncbi:MAG: hypothetical protein ABFD60_08425 [Bryobacteraceae bacterium]